MSLQKHGESSKNTLLLQATRNLISRLKDNEAADPALLAQRAGVVPDPWQADVLRSTAHQIILLVTRQGGKSTISAIRALHRAIYVPESLVLVLAPTYRQSKELFRKIQDAYNALYSPVRLRSESALEMEFANRSRIVALPGKEETIRGFSGVALLIVDEAARVRDELYQAIRPMLAVSGGDILLLSTPFGKRGFFHQEWTEGGSAWHRTKVVAYDCPRISREWLAEEQRAMPDMWYRQEYFCEFVETLDQVFSYDDIQRALDPDVKPLFADRTWRAA